MTGIKFPNNWDIYFPHSKEGSVPNKNLRLLFNFGQPPVERKTDRKWRNLFGTKTSVFDFISGKKQTTLSVFSLFTKTLD